MKNTPPPYNTFVIPQKKLMGKVANLFLLFLNIEMEGWGLLFEVRYHLGWSGGDPNGQNCFNFMKYIYIPNGFRTTKVQSHIFDATLIVVF